MSAEKEWIQTYTGKKFFPLAPENSEFDIRDIARALSMLCRYNGHVARFYSVAEHCVRVSWEVEKRLVEMRLTGADKSFEDRFDRLNCARWGLLHDAAEAYLADIPRPLKHMDAMAPYRAAEKRMTAAIATWAGLEGDEPEIVRDFDTEILGTEVRQLKAPIHPDWHKTTRTGLLPNPLPNVRVGWEPTVAEQFYMHRFRELFPARAGETRRALS